MLGVEALVEEILDESGVADWSAEYDQAIVGIWSVPFPGRAARMELGRGEVAAQTLKQFGDVEQT